MLLTGTFARSIDEKLRVAVPRPLRDILLPRGEGLVYVAPGMDGALSIYAEAAFSQLAERFDEISSTERDVRAFARLFFAQAQSAELDSQGRVRIPPELARLANLGAELVIVGVRDHIELWNRGQWESYLAENQRRFEEIAEAAFRRPKNS